MTSPERRAGPWWGAVLLFAALMAAAQPAPAQEAAPEVWLVTYGPGEIYWQRFGHNAIWIRDAGLGLDHTFNFGFFDFEQEHFFRRFLLGRMLYFSAAQPASQEFAQYIDENRSIRAQRLALSSRQALDLTEFLVETVQPGNRDYLYDYYRDNCSTRVRDALDRALGGWLREAFDGVPAEQNYRDHTRRLTQSDPDLYLGLELVLGAPVDIPISRWEAFFIPALLADGVADLAVAEGGLGSLVVEDVMLHRSSLEPPPVEPGRVWPRYLLPALLIAIVGGLLGRRWPRAPRRLARVWLTAGGLVGTAMVFFWFGTDHDVAATNLNLLLFNPLWLLAAVPSRLDRAVAMLVWVGGVAALLAPWLPPYQYTADVLAAFLPLNVAAGWALYRSQAPSSVSI